MLGASADLRLVETHLHQLSGLDQLRRLLADLDYRVSDEPVSTADWKPELMKAAKEGGLRIVARHQDFVVSHCRLPELRVGPERDLVTRLVRQYDRGLFAFSDLGESHWHLVNVKRDSRHHNRLVLRRIAIGPEEQLRTAIERVALLKIADASWSGLQVEVCHEEAFDVEKVTKEFFERYARVFSRVEHLIQGVGEPERKRLFAQRLFNRLMFTERAPEKFSRPTFPELHEAAQKLVAVRTPGLEPKVIYDADLLHFDASSVGFVPWHCLSGVRNKSIRKIAILYERGNG